MEEILDIFYYLHDILLINNEKLSRILTFHLVEYLVIPLFSANLYQAGLASATTPGQQIEESNDQQQPLHNDNEQSFIPVIELKPKLTLYLLAQFFSIFTHGPLINAAGAILIHPKPEQYSSFYQLIPQLEKFNHLPNYSLIENNNYASLQVQTTPDPQVLSEPESNQASQFDKIYSFRVKSAQNKTSTTNQPTQQQQHKKSLKSYCSFRSVRKEIINLLEKDNDQWILGVLCVLYSIIRNNNFERKLLSQSGLFPHRLEKVQSIFDSLVSPNKSSSSSFDNLFGDNDSASDLFAEPKVSNVSFI